jgi:hypothetical protein
VDFDRLAREFGDRDAAPFRLVTQLRVQVVWEFDRCSLHGMQACHPWVSVATDDVKGSLEDFAGPLGLGHGTSHKALRRPIRSTWI